MPLWAIVPVKPFNRAKSRLASMLSPSERVGLSRSFLGHTLEVLGQVSEIRERLVISRDTSALHLARQMGTRTVTESGAPELNRALRRATEVALSAGADAVLVLPTDLPLLTPEDVLSLVNGGRESPSVAVAPDRRERGTNALYIRPPGLIDYAFGPDSFHRHVALAEAAGVHPHIYRLSGTVLDIDLPEDLRLYRARR